MRIAFITKYWKRFEGYYLYQVCLTRQTGIWDGSLKNSLVGRKNRR